MTLSKDDLIALRDKYAEMRALREARHDEPPTARLASLAARFPGALRELDDRQLADIRAREAALDEAVGDATRVAPWMAACVCFHRAMRGALAAKRWLGRRRVVDDELRAAFRSAASSLPFPEDARAWADDLARVARPPHGRLTDAVFARVAAELHVTPKEARELVFGRPRRDRISGRT